MSPVIPIDLSPIVRILSADPGVQAVFLFGSHAVGRARRDSDIDLAVVPRDDTVRRRKLDLLADLAAAGVDDVDLVFLDTNDVTLRFEAVRQNRLLWAAPDFDHGSFWSRVVREYLDFEPILARQRDALRRRLDHGTA